MDKTIAQQLQDVFNNDYQGYDNFVKNVIEVLFGKESFESYEEDFLDSSDKKVKASQANIIALKKVGVVDHFQQPLEVFDITLDDHSKIVYSRVGIQHFLRSNEGMFNQQHAFLLFHYKDTKDKEWRFSYLYKADKKKDSTSAKRFTYLMGKEHSCRTAVERFSKLIGSTNDDALMETFSVETLSEDFFNTYKKHYLRFCEFLYENRMNRNLFGKYFSDRDDKEVRDYVKKMLGRIVFLCFLQRKGWLCGQQDFLQKVFSGSKHQEHFLDVELEALFFAFLNTEPANRESIFEKHNQEVEADIQWNKSLLKEWKEISYLNGGLFEPDQIDFPKCTFPKEYFQELLDFFAQYNFTIDENDPNDAEVGVDPEMLGKIFENLLEDNKDKGAFYTPKEIVQYMCKESLIAYLSEGVQSTAQQEEIRQFITTHQLPKWSQESCSSMEKKLQNVKICDPAIGSGAFPMGLLNELVALRETIDFAQGGNIINRAELKRQIIQENIYGVDIEKGAIDIARLRFWLSIVVDSEKPEPLPNFDYKFIQGNSLISTYEGQYIDLNKSQPHNAKELMTKKEELAHLQKNLYSLKGEEKHAKEIEAKLKLIDILELQLGVELQKAKDNGSQQLNLFENMFVPESRKKPIVTDKEVQKLIDSLELMRKAYTDDTKSLAVKSSLRLNFFDWNITFSEVFEKNGGFDIVIGNPPYIKEYENKTAFDGFRETSPYYLGKMDLWYGFACHGIDLLKSNATICFIAQNNWTTSAGAKKMRNKIIKDCQILQMLDFNTYMVFKNADIQTMIMLFKRNKDIDNYIFDYRVITKGNEKLDMLAMLSKQKRNTKYLSPVLNRESMKGKLLTFSENDNLFEKIAKGKTYLHDDEVAQGIVFPQDFLDKKGAKKLGDIYPVKTGIFGLSSSEKDAMNLNDMELSLIKPYYTTDQIHRYYTNPKNAQWLIYTDSSFKYEKKMTEYPTIKRHLDKFTKIFTSDNKPYGLHRCRKQSFFQGEKIISLRKCVNKPCFSYSDFDCYVTQTFFSIKSIRWNMKFLTGVLNSRLVAFWLKNKGKKQGNNYQVDKEPLLGIPLPLVYDSLQCPIISLVDKILAAKKVDAEADTSAWEAEIDQLVYELYGLTEEEIRIVEG